MAAPRIAGVNSKPTARNERGPLEARGRLVANSPMLRLGGRLAGQPPKLLKFRRQKQPETNNWEPVAPCILKNDAYFCRSF